VNLLTKKTVVVYLAAVFAAGLLAGAAAGFSLGQRRAFAPPPRPREMAAHMCDDLRSRLHLSPEQVQQIEPILNQTAAELETVHATFGARISEILQKSNQRIAQLVTPEQKVLLDEMERDRQQFLRRGPHGHKPGPPREMHSPGAPPASNP
jgi:Spy/CpxP family protein refolding chaperone